MKSKLLRKGHPFNNVIIAGHVTVAGNTKDKLLAVKDFGLEELELILLYEKELPFAVPIGKTVKKRNS